MTPADLRTLLNAGTPGVWKVKQDILFCGGKASISAKDELLAILEFSKRDQSDAALIVALHNAAPALLDVVEAAQAIPAYCLGLGADPQTPCYRQFVDALTHLAEGKEPDA